MASCLENKTKLIPEAEVDKLAPRWKSDESE